MEVDIDHRQLSNTELKVIKDRRGSVSVDIDSRGEADRMSQSRQSVDWLMLDYVELQVTDAPPRLSAGHVQHAHLPVNWLSSTNHLAHQTSHS